MKKVLYLLLVLIITGPVLSQAGPVERFMRKQAKKDGVHLIRVPGIVKYFAMAHVDEELPKELIKQFKGIRVLTCEKAEGCNVDYAEMGADARKAILKDDYISLIEVLDENETVMIYAKKHPRRKYIKRLVILIRENDELTLLRIKGKFKLDDLNIDQITEITKNI